jgi:hypothetical protein
VAGTPDEIAYLVRPLRFVLPYRPGLRPARIGRGRGLTTRPSRSDNKAKLTMRKAYGFRTFDVTELALYHELGKLPEPNAAHRSY